MRTKKESPIIWIHELQWFSRVDIASTTSSLSLWQSILYIMKKNEIAVEEAKRLEKHLQRLEDKALAEYIEDAIEAGELLHYAIPKKRAGDDKKPKSTKAVPPKDSKNGEPTVQIEDETHLRQLIAEDRQEQSKYLDNLTIKPEDALSWLTDLEEARRELLPDLPLATSIHAFLVAEIKKAKAFRYQEQNKGTQARNKVAPKAKGKTSHLKVPAPKEADESVLEIEWNDILAEHPLPSITKASLNDWPMVAAFALLDDLRKKK